VSDTLFDQYKAALRRGHLAALAGDLEGALEAYALASRLVPERPLPIASQGTVLHRLGRWPEAAEAFDRALSLVPDDETSLRARATARGERGLRSGAAADFERLAFVLDVGGRSTEAADAARRAADLEPSATREALAERLASAAAQAADLVSARPMPAGAPGDRLPEAAAPPENDEADTAPGPIVEEAGPAEVMSAASAALAAKIAELGTQPEWVDLGDRPVGAAAGDQPEGGHWPPIDLPSPPPLPIDGPPPDPESLLAEAAALIDAGDTAAARDLMLTAAIVHRAAGRLDAALEVCLQLLTTAPGDPQVHLAIANLQLDRGWTAVAAEKIDLLARLTALTGDTQAEADVHGLAADRLRDVSLSQTTGR
jgi:tetratricopeptide (TPR) repeat protein